MTTLGLELCLIECCNYGFLGRPKTLFGFKVSLFSYKYYIFMYFSFIFKIRKQFKKSGKEDFFFLLKNTYLYR